MDELTAPKSEVQRADFDFDAIHAPTRICKCAGCVKRRLLELFDAMEKEFGPPTVNETRSDT